MLVKCLARPGTCWRCDCFKQAGTILPFLYQTPTIRRTAYINTGRGARPLYRAQRSSVKARKEIDDTSALLQLQQDHKQQAQHNSPRPAPRDWAKRPGENDRPMNGGNHKGGSRDKREAKVAPKLNVSEDHVPFENMPEAGVEDMEDSTITPNERKIFENLFNRGRERRQRGVEASTLPGKPVSPQKLLGDVDNIDDILESAVHNIKTGRESHPVRAGRRKQANGRRKPTQSVQDSKTGDTNVTPALAFPAALLPLARQALLPRRVSEQHESAGKNFREAGEVRKAIVEDLRRVAVEMERAATDVDLHLVLQSQVLSRVAALQLDGPMTPAQQSAFDALKHQERMSLASERGQGPVASHSRPAGPSDLEVLTGSLPRHLAVYTNILRTHFPRSPYLLSLLPTIHQLGPSAFALAATTPLYNAHLSALYAALPPSTALAAMSEVLQEMDRAVYAFDDGTQELLDRVLRDAAALADGRSGEGLRALWTTERVRRELRAMVRWREVVLKRRQEEALRKAREEEAVREEDAARGMDEGEVESAKEVATAF